jgi:hypothetical protein
MLRSNSSSGNGPPISRSSLGNNLGSRLSNGESNCNERPPRSRDTAVLNVAKDMTLPPTIFHLGAKLETSSDVLRSLSLDVRERVETANERLDPVKVARAFVDPHVVSVLGQRSNQMVSEGDSVFAIDTVGPASLACSVKAQGNSDRVRTVGRSNGLPQAETQVALRPLRGGHVKHEGHPPTVRKGSRSDFGNNSPFSEGTHMCDLANWNWLAERSRDDRCKLDRRSKQVTPQLQGMLSGVRVFQLSASFEVNAKCLVGQKEGGPQALDLLDECDGPK